MKRKTIDAVVKYFFPVVAGIETNMWETYRRLAKKGWSVTIHTSKDTLTKQDVLIDHERMGNIVVKRYPYRWWGFLPAIDYVSTDVVSLHNFNVVPHTYILLVGLVKKLFNQKKFKLVLVPHGGFTPDWSIFSRSVAFIKRFYHYTLGTLLINTSVDAVRAVSSWEKREVVGKGVNPHLVTTITNGIEDEAYSDVDHIVNTEFKREVRRYGTYIVQIGRIYPIKNYETTIRALVRIPAHVNYVIVGPVGDTLYLEKLKKLIRELGLTKRVFFVDVLRGVEKYYLMKRAQMMVHMARWESFCNVVHEGMSQGLVCIVADNTALPFLIKNGVNGYCVPTNDSDIVAQKINFVLSHKHAQEIRVMEKRNRAFGREESWEHVSQKLHKLFTKLTV